MFAHLPDHKKGLLLTSLGGLALSMDIPLIRLSSGEVWSVLSARSLATIVVALAALFVIRRVTGSLQTVLPGRLGIPVGFFYGLTTITFLLAVYYTKAANVVFIIALNPMFTALLSWIFLKERPALSTFITMAVMILGVGLIVGDGMEAGHLLGDALSVIASLSIACAITISRASGRDMGFASLLAAVIPAAVGIYHIAPTGFSIEHPGWILFDGALLMPLSFWCLATGTRFLSAPEVDVLPSGNDPGADLGLADLFRGADQHDACRRRHPDPGTGRPLALAGACQSPSSNHRAEPCTLKQRSIDVITKLLHQS